MGVEPGKALVGYGRPPAEHRFQKGKSGNPNGRPSGAKNKPAKVNTGHGLKATEEFLRIEAYRPITIREGENIIELPAIQAVFRAMGVSAMKGNRFAQKTLAELVTRMEAEHHQSRMELFGNAVEYKVNWEHEIDRCREQGRPEPAPIPHPDDIILDTSNGGVRFKGPQTKQERERLDEALSRMAQAQIEVIHFAEKFRRARNEKMKSVWLDEWHWEQRMFDVLNDIVPKRYKMKLENRSYREGASREGKALDELRRKRKLRQEYAE